MKYYILSYNQAPIGNSHDSKLEFDFANACKECGTGALLIGRLKLSGINKLKRDFFETYIGDYIVSEELLNYLKNKNLISEDLKKIQNLKDSELEYYQLYTHVTLPPAIQKDGLVTENQCPVCKRNGFFYKLSKRNEKTIAIPSGIVYSTYQINEIGNHHFFFTWECFGYSNLVANGNNVVGFARPLLIVSEKFKNAFEEFKVMGAEFEPIVIEDHTIS